MYCSKLQGPPMACLSKLQVHLTQHIKEQVHLRIYHSYVYVLPGLRSSQNTCEHSLRVCMQDSRHISLWKLDFVIFILLSHTKFLTSITYQLKPLSYFMNKATLLSS